MKFAICDDNLLFIKTLEKYLDKYQIDEKTNFQIDSFSSIEELSKACEENFYELIFLDIEFPEKSGIDFANSLRFSKEDFKTEIIFVSGSKAYFRELFSFQPFGFLKKPIDYKDLKKILDSYLKKSRAAENIFSYKKNTSTYYLPMEDIIYFMSSARKVEVFSTEASDSFYARLDDLEDKLDPKVFIRVHKSFLVNMNFIDSISPSAIILKNGMTISVSKKYSKNILSLLEGRFGG